MIQALGIPGAFRVDGHLAEDERGVFRKVFDSAAGQIPMEFRELDEVAISHNRVAGTLRGLHLQDDPFGQTKVVWVASGRIMDVLVDLRVDSPAYGRWISLELDADSASAVLIPTGVAHGFQTLVDETNVVYLMRGGFAPESARTLRWNDPTLAIPWPLPVSVISPKDQQGESWPGS